MDKLRNLIVDNYNGTVVAENFSQSDIDKSIHEQLVALNDGSDKLDLYSSGNKKLFRLLSEVLNTTILEGLERSNNPLFDYVDYRNLAKGDDITFKIKDNSLYVVSSVAVGTQALRRQRIPAGRTLTVETQLKGIKIYEELERVLAGRVNFNEFIAKVAESFERAITNAIYNAFISATASVSAPYSKSAQVVGTLVEADLLEVIDHVEAATGATAVIIGSKQAVRQLNNIIVGKDAYSAKEDLYNVGYYGHIGVNPVIALKNVHAEGTTTFVLPDDEIYVIAGNTQKFIKFVTKGETFVLDKDPTANQDLSLEYLMLQEWGTAVVFADKGVGVYKF